MALDPRWNSPNVEDFCAVLAALTIEIVGVLAADGERSEDLLKTVAARLSKTSSKLASARTREIIELLAGRLVSEEGSI